MVVLDPVGRRDEVRCAGGGGDEVRDSGTGYVIVGGRRGGAVQGERGPLLEGG